VPLFILAGDLMEFGGIARRMVALARAFVGHFRGGLGITVVGSEMLFSGISGSTTADVSAMTSMLLPSMKRAGYTAEYAIAIVSAASALGILVPPCIVMVVFGAMANVSVAALFMAGFLPAFVLAGILIALLYYQARKMGFPRDPKIDLLTKFKRLREAAVPLAMPIIIFGGILGGIFTPTEAAAVAVVYAFFVGVFVYKEIPLKDVPRILVKTCTTTGMILFLIGVSSIFSYLLAVERVPHAVGTFVLSISSSKCTMLLASCLLVFLLSIVIEVLPAGLIVIPIFLPFVDMLDISRLHFIILVIISGGLGMFTPPTGVGLIIACSIGNVSMEQATKPLLPLLLALFIGVFILILAPDISTFVPNLLGL
jgi:C4-dicarboxylate transporter DctM subunit